MEQEGVWRVRWPGGCGKCPSLDPTRPTDAAGICSRSCDDQRTFPRTASLRALPAGVAGAGTSPAGVGGGAVPCGDPAHPVGLQG